MCKMISIHKAGIKEKVRIEDIGLLDEGLSAGKGVVALTAHIGNWELAGIVASIVISSFMKTILLCPCLTLLSTR